MDKEILTGIIYILKPNLGLCAAAAYSMHRFSDVSLLYFAFRVSIVKGDNVWPVLSLCHVSIITGEE